MYVCMYVCIRLTSLQQAHEVIQKQQAQERLTFTQNSETFTRQIVLLSEQVH